MPTYDYLCSKCGRFEYFQKISELPLTNCPQCDGPVKRLISLNTNIIFKGSGFYVTDHRKPEYKKKAKEEMGTATSDTSQQASSTQKVS